MNLAAIVGATTGRYGSRRGLTVLRNHRNAVSHSGPRCFPPRHRPLSPTAGRVLPFRPVF